MPPILGQPLSRTVHGRRLEDARTSFLAGLLFSFQGPSDRFFETHCVEGVGNDQASRAYSSVGLERTPDKREVGGSNPPRPTTFRRLACMGL